jgi:hypothetical protein
MNREKVIRQAYYNVLNGNLSYNSINVPIYDEKVESNEDVYVLMVAQDAVDTGDFHRQSWISTITFDIVSKQYASVSKDIVDAVSEQIENIVKPTASAIGLEQQAGWQITNVRLSQVNYSEPGVDDMITIFKTITFTQTISKS